MRIALISAAIVAVLTIAMIGERYARHHARVTDLLNRVAFDERYYQRFRDIDDGLHPVIDAWNHARVKVNDGAATQGLSGVILIQAALDHAKFEEAKIDRSTAALNSALDDIHHEEHTSIRKTVKGAFEQYWHASDEWKDSTAAWLALTKAAIANPLSASYDDGETASANLKHAWERFDHRFQIVIDLGEALVYELKARHTSDEALLRRENAQWLSGAR